MKEVTVYTSRTCPYCIAVKEYLKEKNIPFVEKNISTDPNAKRELLALGYSSVPIIITQKDIIVGFDQNQMNKIAEIKG